MLMLRGVSQTIADGGTLSFGVSSFRSLANSGAFLHDGRALCRIP